MAVGVAVVGKGEALGSQGKLDGPELVVAATSEEANGNCIRT